MLLTNANVWSPDSQWVVFDRRSEPSGAIFNGTRIDRLHVESGCIETLYESRNGAHVGVVTVNPVDGNVIFIHGPEHPSADWSYSACHREGVIVDPERPGVGMPLDARNLVPPFTPGALRGGSHVHTWDSTGTCVSFTYEDHLVPNRRTVGLAIPGPVKVPKSHPRNRDGAFTSVVSVTLKNDGIMRAFEDAWIPNQNAITFIGEVRARDGRSVNELFRLDYPDRFDIPSPGPAHELPAAPSSFHPIRLTYFAEQPNHRGLATLPRHWPRASPDGHRVACLIEGGQLMIVRWDRSMTAIPIRVQSAFTWHPNGRHLAAVVNDCVSLIDSDSGDVTPLAKPGARPEACVVSPDGRRVAYIDAYSAAICIASCSNVSA